jgi:hypothetical protein
VIPLPRRYLPALQTLAVRTLESHPRGADDKTLARTVLLGVADLLIQSGLEGVLVELDRASPPVPADDRHALADHPVYAVSFATAIGALELDGGGPRNQRPLRLADAVLATLGLELVDDAPMTALPDTTRAEVVTAIASVVDVEIALPRLRDAIIELARASLELRYHHAFEKIAANLDERGMRVDKIPKVPLDAVQVVQQALADARRTHLATVGRAAIDRALPAIERADPEAAARVDKPVTHALTPRDVAIARATAGSVPKTPSAVARALLDGLVDAARLAWSAADKPVRPYAASQVFQIGEVVEHVKFGRGEVTATGPKRIDVEFADGMHTLVHAGLITAP